MERKMKTGFRCTLLLVMLLAGLACLTSCSIYSSHYSATMLVQSNTSQRASVSFSTLDGRMVFKMKSKADSAGLMNFTASLGEGHLTVKVDCPQAKADLLDLFSGDSYSGQLDDIGAGTVYVIIETDGKCHDGNFNFTLE